MNEGENWDKIIEPKTGLFQLNLKDVWRYRDLLFLFVKRDFVAVYKQTILGPLWFLVQPLLTTLMFTFVFGRLAGISTDGIPPLLFYMAGITLWTYFADCLNKTSTTFLSNANIFGKVYFPRLIVPLSVLLSSLIKLGIQFTIFIFIWLYYVFFSSYDIQPNWNYIAFLPLLVILMAGLGLGLGIFISSLTTKYRDLTFLLGFGIQLLMYLSPVVYPLSIASESTRELLLYNPVAIVVETFKLIFLGKGFFEWTELAYSFCVMFFILLCGIVVFNRVEKGFMDTV